MGHCPPTHCPLLAHSAPATDQLLDPQQILDKNQTTISKSTKFSHFLVKCLYHLKCHKTLIASWSFLHRIQVQQNWSWFMAQPLSTLCPLLAYSTGRLDHHFQRVPTLLGPNSIGVLLWYWDWYWDWDGILRVKRPLLVSKGFRSETLSDSQYQS